MDPSSNGATVPGTAAAEAADDPSCNCFRCTRIRLRRQATLTAHIGNYRMALGRPMREQAWQRAVAAYNRAWVATKLRPDLHSRKVAASYSNSIHDDDGTAQHAQEPEAHKAGSGGPPNTPYGGPSTSSGNCNYAVDTGEAASWTSESLLPHPPSAPPQQLQQHPSLLPRQSHPPLLEPAGQCKGVVAGKPLPFAPLPPRLVRRNSSGAVNSSSSSSMTTFRRSGSASGGHERSFADAVNGTSHSADKDSDKSANAASSSSSNPATSGSFNLSGQRPPTGTSPLAHPSTSESTREDAHWAHLAELAADMAHARRALDDVTRRVGGHASGVLSQPPPGLGAASAAGTSAGPPALAPLLSAPRGAGGDAAASRGVVDMIGAARRKFRDFMARCAALPRADVLAERLAAAAAEEEEKGEREATAGTHGGGEGRGGGKGCGRRGRRADLSLFGCGTQSPAPAVPLARALLALHCHMSSARWLEDNGMSGDSNSGGGGSLADLTSILAGDSRGSNVGSSAGSNGSSGGGGGGGGGGGQGSGSQQQQTACWHRMMGAFLADAVLQYHGLPCGLPYMDLLRLAEVLSYMQESVLLLYRTEASGSTAATTRSTAAATTSAVQPLPSAFPGCCLSLLAAQGLLRCVRQVTEKVVRPRVEKSLVVTLMERLKQRDMAAAAATAAKTAAAAAGGGGGSGKRSNGQRSSSSTPNQPSTSTAATETQQQVGRLPSLADVTVAVRRTEDDLVRRMLDCVVKLHFQLLKEAAAAAAGTASGAGVAAESVTAEEAASMFQKRHVAAAKAAVRSYLETAAQRELLLQQLLRQRQLEEQQQQQQQQQALRRLQKRGAGSGKMPSGMGGGSGGVETFVYEEIYKDLDLMEAIAQAAIARRLTAAIPWGGAGAVASVTAEATAAAVAGGDDHGDVAAAKSTAVDVVPAPGAVQARLVKDVAVVLRPEHKLVKLPTGAQGPCQQAGDSERGVAPTSASTFFTDGGAAAEPEVAGAAAAAAAPSAAAAAAEAARTGSQQRKEDEEVPDPWVQRTELLRLLLGACLDGRPGCMAAIGGAALQLAVGSTAATVQMLGSHQDFLAAFPPDCRRLLETHLGTAAADGGDADGSADGGDGGGSSSSSSSNSRDLTDGRIRNALVLRVDEATCTETSQTAAEAAAATVTTAGVCGLQGRPAFRLSVLPGNRQLDHILEGSKYFWLEKTGNAILVKGSTAAAASGGGAVGGSGGGGDVSSSTPQQLNTSSSSSSFSQAAGAGVQAAVQQQLSAALEQWGSAALRCEGRGALVAAMQAIANLQAAERNRRRVVDRVSGSGDAGGDVGPGGDDGDGGGAASSGGGGGGGSTGAASLLVLPSIEEKILRDQLRDFMPVLLRWYIELVCRPTATTAGRTSGGCGATAAADDNDRIDKKARSLPLGADTDGGDGGGDDEGRSPADDASRGGGSGGSQIRLHDGGVVSVRTEWRRHRRIIFNHFMSGLLALNGQQVSALGARLPLYDSGEDGGGGGLSAATAAERTQMLDAMRQCLRVGALCLTPNTAITLVVVRMEKDEVDAGCEASWEELR